MIGAIDEPHLPRAGTRDFVSSLSRRPGSAAGTAARSAGRNTFLLLRHRNFRLFLFGLVISQTGSWMENATLQWLSYQLTGSTVLLGEVAAAGTAPMVIFSMWGGWVADHYSKRTILLITQIAWTVTAFAICILTWTGAVQPWHIIVIALINGVVNGFDLPARQAFIMEMTSREELLTAISLNSSVVNGARIVGPAAAGLIIYKMGPTLGPSVCFLANAVSFFAAIIGLLMMVMPIRVRPVRAETPIKQVLKGLAYVVDNFRVRVLMILFTVVGIFGWSYNVLLPAFARDTLHLGPEGFGSLMASAGVGRAHGGDRHGHLRRIFSRSAGPFSPASGISPSSLSFFRSIGICIGPLCCWR